MKTAILHITDIHIKQNASNNHILKKADRIFEAFRNQVSDMENLIIVVTGDIAFSGLEKEYDLAYIFFDDLIKKLEKYTKQLPVIIFIPGNHDCDFSGDQTIRNLVIEKVKETWYKNINEQIIKTCTEVQLNFWNFVTRFNNTQINTIFSHSLLNVYEFTKNEKNIIFNCFNTSWISKLKEEEGQMAFPTEYFGEEKIIHKSDLTINLIHHPINWQNNTHHREFRKLLEESGDLILSGHEHQTNQREVSEMGGQTTIYLESGALQDDIVSRSAFNLYTFDLQKASYNYYEYSLIDGQYTIKVKLEDKQYDHRYSLAKKEFSYDPKFINYLSSTDAQYTHPQTDNLLLTDIYVDLKLKEISLDEKESLSIPKHRAISDLVYKNDAPLKWCIIGAESSGKTALLKTLSMRFYNQDQVPIFLKGENLTDISFDKIKKIVKNAFCDQYDRKCQSKYDRLDKNKIILIIDNFQNCNIRGEFKAKMLQSLNDVSERQVFSSNTMLVFDAIKDEKRGKTLDYFKDFTSYHIAEMGADLRYDIIDKWNKIGKDFTNDEDRNFIYQLNDTYRTQIKATLGLNYIPNYPFYILTLLTSLSSGKTGNDYSLSGYYYESLISQALDDSVSDKDALQFYNQFLCEFFYYMFDSKLKNINITGFQRFYQDYGAKYEVKEDLERVTRALINAKILRGDGEFISFTYKYVYYYFVAKFFATNITDPFYKDQISKMCKRLYREEFSNIIIFLTHLSKDPFIITEIYSNAQSQFQNIGITKFEEDILAINELVENIPELVMSGDSIEGNRAIKYLTEAEDEEIERQFEISRGSLDYDVNEDITTLDFLNEMIRSIKTYELLGQITKKYWGSIKGPNKYAYAKETFDLALRTLNTYFRYILEHNDGIIEALKYIAKKKNISDLTTLKEVTNSYIFKLCCMVSQGSIQRISNSIGHRKLKETFEKIVEDDPNNCYRLIDVAIKLDHARFPQDEIDCLINDPSFTKNFLPKYLLQSLVYNHVAIFVTNIKEKQMIYDKLQIKVKDQRRIDLSSAVKK
ncbi:MAG: metallophosphoesterase [Bacteroidia bacterium]